MHIPMQDNNGGNWEGVEYIGAPCKFLLIFQNDIKNKIY